MWARIRVQSTCFWPLLITAYEGLHDAYSHDSTWNSSSASAQAFIRFLYFPQWQIPCLFPQTNMSHQKDLTKKKLLPEYLIFFARELILCFNISNWPKTRSLVALHQTPNVPNQIFYKPQKVKQTSLLFKVGSYTQRAVRVLLWVHNTGRKAETLASFTLRDRVSTEVMNMKICKGCWLKRNILWQHLSWVKEERERVWLREC